MTDDVPYVSVIIPTYNREKMLGITIESFIKQTYPVGRYEIIISDNNSNDNTKYIVHEWQGKSNVAIKYFLEARQGSHYARNSAAKIAKGDILYFTDDDMIADKDLLTNLIKVFLMDYHIASATGRILPKWETEPPQWILKYCYNGLLGLNDRSEQLIIAPFDINAFSGHQAVLREAFFKSGGFNPDIIGGEWIGDNEVGLNIKIKELGYNFAFVGDSVIYHVIPHTRMTQSYLNKRLANQGNSDSCTEYREYRYNSAQLVVRLFKYLKNICVLFFKVAPRLVLGRDSWRLHVAQLYYNMNRIKYDMRLIYDEKWRSLVLKYNWLEE